jgi:glycosyltransferase involved in cell wall biosynthesis
MCGPLAGLAGGDTHALRFVDRWEKLHPGKVAIIAPPYMAAHLSAPAARRVIPLRTPLDNRVHSLAIYAAAVVIRMLLTIVRMPSTRIAISSSHFFHDVIPCVAARLRHGTRVAVFIYHLVDDMDRDRSLRSMVSTAGERLSLWLLRRWSDVVFVDNEHVAESLRRRRFAADRIVMTANAFDPLVPLPPRATDGPPLLAYCGRFVEEKGIWDVLELGRALAKSAPEARIEMIGDGPLRQAFADRISEEKVGNVRLNGFVSEEDKWALLRRAHLFIAPSREEGWGIAVGEALTAGTPVIAYDLPAYRYLGDAIERVPVGDTQGFVRAVERLLHNPPELAAKAAALRDAESQLPRWDEVLAAEFAALRSRCLS